MRRALLSLATGGMCAAGTLPSGRCISAATKPASSAWFRIRSGAVLPGVTVEASSPVLIEHVRTAVTDSAGRYADHRSAARHLRRDVLAARLQHRVRREGIVLEGAFAAHVNASLAVGASRKPLPSPAHRRSSTLQSTQNQFGRQPRHPRRAAGRADDAGRRQPGARRAVLQPGLRQHDVGPRIELAGSADLLRRHEHRAEPYAARAARRNGVGVNELGAGRSWSTTPASQSAETALGGVRMDSIPKEGGNRSPASGGLFGSNGALQSDNITDELRPLFPSGNRLDYSYEMNVVLGGPIQRDSCGSCRAARLETNNLIPLPNVVPPARRARRNRAVRWRRTRPSD